MIVVACSTVSRSGTVIKTVMTEAIEHTISFVQVYCESGHGAHNQWFKCIGKMMIMKHCAPLILFRVVQSLYDGIGGSTRRIYLGNSKSKSRRICVRDR